MTTLANPNVSVDCGTSCEAASAANKNIRFRPWGSRCFGLLSVVLAVLKLTVAGCWSWWRVMLSFLAFLDHNAVYLLAGYAVFRVDTAAFTQH